MVVVEPPSGGSIDLAKVNYPISMSGANRKDALIIAVMRNGSVFFGNDRLTPEQLSPVLRERLIHRTGRTIYLKVDERAKYADVAGVLDSLRSAGVGSVSFLLDQRKLPVLSN
jgi:biopolymer transport protein ExbD